MCGGWGGTREDSRIQVVKIHYIYACKYHHNETSVHNKYLLLTIKAEIKKNKMYHKRDKKCNLTSFNYEFIPVQQQKGEMGAELDLLQLEVPKAFI